jgi:hypothetical protein
MFQAGIRYLSKEKDGIWRFYVDYRALNKGTMSDKFSVTVIDEFLDKLNVAEYFHRHLRESQDRTITMVTSYASGWWVSSSTNRGVGRETETGLPTV